MMLFKRRKLVKTLHQLIAQVTSDLPPDDIELLRAAPRQAGGSPCQ
jgi:hypothetical protein